MISRSMLRLLLAALLFGSPSAHALLFRAYLASDGSDANPCTLTLPCRLLPAALAATQNEGEVWILDSANYNTGPVSISQAVTILAVPGAAASFLSVLSISTPEVVTLRNLTFPPGGGGAEAILVNQVTQLNVEGCRFWYRQVGIAIANSNSAVRVVDSTFEWNFDGAIAIGSGATVWVTGSHITGGTGIWMAGGPAKSVLHVTRSAITKAVYAIDLRGSFAPTLAYINDSELSGNGAAIHAHSPCTPDSQVSCPNEVVVTGSMLVSNWTAVSADGLGAKVVLSATSIMGNETGYQATGSAVLESAGNNLIRGNGTNTGSLASIGLQ